MKTNWSYVFFIVLVIDALTTIFTFGEEANPIILWTMNTFGWNLEGAMVAKMIYSFPLLYFIDYFGGRKWVLVTLISYVGLYLFWMVKML